MENWKARDADVKLWWGTESWWELEEHRDLVGLWCCKMPVAVVLVSHMWHVNWKYWIVNMSWLLVCSNPGSHILYVVCIQCSDAHCQLSTVCNWTWELWHWLSACSWLAHSFTWSTWHLSQCYWWSAAFKSCSEHAGGKYWSLSVVRKFYVVTFVYQISPTR